MIHSRSFRQQSSSHKDQPFIEHCLLANSGGIQLDLHSPLSFTIIEVSYYKLLLGMQMTKIQYQNLSRTITSNQILSIPLHCLGFCIPPR